MHGRYIQYWSSLNKSDAAFVDHTLQIGVLWQKIVTFKWHCPKFLHQGDTKCGFLWTMSTQSHRQPFFNTLIVQTLVLNLPLKLSPSLTNSPLIKQSILPHSGMKKVKNCVLHNSSNKTVLSANSWNTKSYIAFFCDQIVENQPSVTGGNWHTSNILQTHQHFQVSLIFHPL